MSENRRNSVFKKHIEKMLLQILFICDNKIAPRQTDSCPSFVFYQFNLRTHSVLGTEFRTEFGWSKVNFGKRTKRILCLCPNKSFPKAKRFQKSKCLTPSQSFARMCGYLFHNFHFLQHDCQLSGCSDGGLCTFIEASKTFTCVNHCVGSPCLNGGSCRNLAEGYKCSCIAGQFAGKQCEQGKNSLV